MLTVDTKLSITFLDLVDGQINRLQENIASGNLDNIADYKRETGRIRGLREAVELMDEALRKINGGSSRET